MARSSTLHDLNVENAKKLVNGLVNAIEFEESISESEKAER